MNTFFTSDTHFDHANIIKYCNRPFSSVQEMNEGLIENWNRKVQPGDTVYHMGDFSLGRAPAETFLNRLNGNIHLIIGNHEGKAMQSRQRFVYTRHYDEIHVNGQGIVLCHFPLKIWNKGHHGYWHLYGHCHGTLPDDGKRKSFDIGVDCHNYEPLSFEEVKALMDKRPIEVLDHHG